ncbi:UBX domain-containing protein 4-like isoform X1 [Atheta coriaria]|uniref:UBX domain-containing protein 4-like isoform X1 n=1 Tax=Dalotia coriaria TaxID=877792 RepID=UPI0031F4400E
MEWYQGGIAEAVTESRKNGSIFVVYIEGKDDQSKQVTSTINAPQVAKMLNSSNFVAILVEKDSVTHQQFSEIYKQTTAPSIYFIGKTGAPLEIITDASLTPTDMAKKINQILVKNGGQPMVPMELEDEEKKETSSFTPAPAPTPAQEQPPNEPLQVAPSTSDNQISIEEKLRLAQELIAKKRQEKQEEEKEKERNKEIERRQLGKDVQKMKRWQQDQDIKNLMDERQKERREDQEARERVRRQIEEDKREKAARMNNTQPQATPKEAPRMPVRAVNSDTARLQFRLPDGSQITHDFKSSACLQEVIDYLQLHENQRDFILSTTFPKREFTVNDASQNLMDLQLVPNAAVLVLPSVRRTTVANSNSSGGLSGMFWYVLAPILNFLEYLKSFVWGAAPRPPTTNENKRPNTDTDPPAAGSSKKRYSGETTVKKQGNIHRLHEHDSDEDNNTWNGNSTQQM